MVGENLKDYEWVPNASGNPRIATGHVLSIAEVANQSAHFWLSGAVCCDRWIVFQKAWPNNIVEKAGCERQISPYNCHYNWNRFSSNRYWWKICQKMRTCLTLAYPMFFWFGQMNSEICRVFIVGRGGITLVVNWWFGILGRPLGNNPFHNRIPKIQIAKPNHQLSSIWG